MRKSDFIDILRQCRLILECVDNSQMPDYDAHRIELFVNNIRTIIFTECNYFKE